MASKMTRAAWATRPYIYSITWRKMPGPPIQRRSRYPKLGGRWTRRQRLAEAARILTSRTWANSLPPNMPSALANKMQPTLTQHHGKSVATTVCRSGDPVRRGIIDRLDCKCRSERASRYTAFPRRHIPPRETRRNARFHPR